MYSATLKNELILPIWKMNLSPDEVTKVKTSLMSSYARHGLICPSIDDKINAFICFAEWWRNEYNGGKASEMDVVRYIGLPSSAVVPLYKTAREGLSLLHIKTIRSSKNYELRFRTMLLQGGIPKSILFGDNMSRFVQFLTKMCEELKDIAIDDWSDASIVDCLSCKYYLPPSFRKDDIYALGLEIVHAVLRDRLDLLPFDASGEEFKALIDKLKGIGRTVGQRKRSPRPFSFTWELSINGNEGKLFYTLDNLRFVSVEFLGTMAEKAYQFVLEVDGKKIANYRKSNDGYVRMSMANSRSLWKGESYLDVRAVTHDFDSKALPVANNCPPDFRTPQVFNYNGSMYVQKNTDQSSQSVVIFDPSLWDVDGVQKVSIIRICDKEYAVCYFNNEIVLDSRIGDEPFVAKNSFTDYFVTFQGIDIDWIDTAGFTLISGKPNIEVYSSEDVVSSGAYKTYYKSVHSHGWSELRRAILPHGLLHLQVVFPDGKSSQQEFYNIEGLSIEVTEASGTMSTIKAICAWGTVLCHNQKGVDITQKSPNVWVLTRDYTTAIVPERVTFTIKVPDNPDLILSIPSPFNIFCLEDVKTGVIADTATPISLSNLDRYVILYRGAIKPTVLIKYSSDTPQKASSATLRFSVKDHITPLSKFEAAVNSIIDLNGHNPFNRDEGVIFCIGDTKYKIRPFVIDSLLDNDSVVVTGSDDDYNGNLYACEVGDNITNGELNVKPLIHTNSPCIFSLEGAEDDAKINTPFIVFSGPSDSQRLIPKLLSEDTYSVKLSSKTATWIEKLKDDDPCQGLAWREVTNAFEIATDYNLPYKTFNQLKAAASSPEHFCHFLIALFFNDKQEKALVGILRFEQEFSIALHWIRHTIWWKASDEYLRSAQDLKEFFEFLTGMVALTSGYPPFIGSGPTLKSGSYVFQVGEVNSMRAASNYALHDGAVSPAKKIFPVGRYIPEVAKGSMRGEQYTLIYSPILVAEYLLGKRDDLWDSTDDMMETRRIISFYSREFHEVYNDVLEKELK